MFIFPGLIQSLLYFHFYDTLHIRAIALKDCQEEMVAKLDPVGSTVRYEMMKLCTGSV